MKIKIKGLRVVLDIEDKRELEVLVAIFNNNPDDRVKIAELGSYLSMEKFVRDDVDFLSDIWRALDKSLSLYYKSNRLIEAIAKSKLQLAEDDDILLITEP